MSNFPLVFQPRSNSSLKMIEKEYFPKLKEMDSSKQSYSINNLTKCLNNSRFRDLFKNSKNLDDNEIHVIENNIINTSWFSISSNRISMYILEKIKNQNKVDMYYFLMVSNNYDDDLSIRDDKYLSINNLIIHEIDYNSMRENCKNMAEEIAKIVWHPSRMSRWPEDQLYDDDKSTDDSSTDDQSIDNPSSTIRTIKINIRRRS